MGSSLPRHGARVKTRHKDKTKKNKKKKTKGRLQVSTKKYRNNNLHDAWTDKCHDACSNAVITSSN